MNEPAIPPTRREFLTAVAASLAAASLAPEDGHAQQPVQPVAPAEVAGTEHWTTKRAGADNVKLFLWRKRLQNPATSGAARQGTILFVHGSSVSATRSARTRGWPCACRFILAVPGRLTNSLNGRKSLT